MRILVTGSNGMLGSDLVSELSPVYDVWGLGRSSKNRHQIPYLQADISDRSSLLKAISTAKPAIILHAAAFTDVDACELNSKQAFLINTKGTEWVAQASDANGATLFFMSTDYVFDGTKPTPYEETDTPNPLSVYGRTKFEAEEFLKTQCRSAWIIRSSWLFGANGKNFFKAIVDTAVHNKALRVVNDQCGAPTYTKDLAKALRILIEKGERAAGCSVYHLANSGETAWFDAAKRVLEKMNSNVPIAAIPSTELNHPAERPRNSVLNMARIKRNFGIQLRSWEGAFDEFWTESLEKEWQNLIESKQNSATK